MGNYLKNRINSSAKKEKKRNFSDRLKIHHKVNKRSGLYGFVFKNVLKLILILISIVVFVLLLNNILLASGIDMKVYVEKIINKSQTVWVFIIFFISESILGWIPPDFFIVWAQKKPCDFWFLNVSFLAILSYVGGFTAYKIGELIRRFPRINSYVEKKNAQYFYLVKKWGGLVIIMAALFPLPFATTSTIAGILGYPVKNFLLFGLTRFTRFYAYAAFIFWGINNIL